MDITHQVHCLGNGHLNLEIVVCIVGQTWQSRQGREGRREEVGEAMGERFVVKIASNVNLSEVAVQTYEVYLVLIA